MRYWIVFVLMLACAGQSGSLSAHEGHDHGAEPPPVSTTIAPRTEASSAEFELAAIARGRELHVFLDTFRGNEPVAGASITVETANGPLKAKQTGEGAYVAAADWLLTPGNHDLAFTIEAGNIVDILAATLTVPKPEPKPLPPSPIWESLVSPALVDEIKSRVQFDRSLWVTAAIAFLSGLLFAALLFRLRKRAAVALAGFAMLAGGTVSSRAESIALPDASQTAAPVIRDLAQRFADGAIFVPKPTQRILSIRTHFTEIQSYSGTVELPARVIPDPNGSGLVQASVTGRLLPPPSGFPRLGTRVAKGTVLALVEPTVGTADVTTIQEQARGLDQQISLVERRLSRMGRLKNVIARSQVEDAEIELSGLKKRRASLDNTMREPESLTAPVDGVVAAVQATAGQMAEPNSIIFQIVDPDRLWVEALSYQTQAIAGRAVGQLSDSQTVSLVYQGTGLADRNQAIPVHFSIESGQHSLRVGQLLFVLASTQDEKRGIAVPRESVLRGANGQSIVYEHVSAERFVPREVRVEPLDGERVLIVSGVDAGRRVVTQGAELLNQIR